MDYLVLSLVMLLAQFSPGPDMLLLLRNSLQHPAKAGLCTVAGIAAGLSVHLSVVLVGLGAVIQNSSLLYAILLTAGGLWLARLAVLLLKSLPSMPRAGEGGAHASTIWPLASQSAFLQGFVTNLTNVKVMVFLGGSVLPMLGESPSWGRKLAIFGIIIGQALFFWSLFVLALQHPAVRRLWNRSQRLLTGLFGFSLLFLSLWAIGEGIIRLARK